MANNDINQVILTTHSPAIVKMLSIESLRLITKNICKETIVLSIYDNPDILKQISEDLGILPNIEPFNITKVKLAICVEGKNDIAFLKNINQSVPLLKKIIDFGRNDIIFIPMGGSSIQFWINEDYLGKLNLSQFHIYDSDIGSTIEHKYLRYINIINGRARSFGTETKMREFENYVPVRTLKNKYKTLNLDTIKNWEKTDIPELIAKHVHDSSTSKNHEWRDLPDEKKKRKIGNIKNKMNNEFVLDTKEEDWLECNFFEEIKNWHEHIATLLK